MYDKIEDAGLKGRDFLSTQDWSIDELETLFSLAARLKADRKAGVPTRLLEDKTLYMIFFDSSTRTRNSFETGITQLGGHGIFLSPDKMQRRSRSVTARSARGTPTCRRWRSTPPSPS